MGVVHPGEHRRIQSRFKTFFPSFFVFLYINMRDLSKLFILFSNVAGQTDDTRIELEARFNWSWDMTNTCGPRPHGPKYPAPPDFDEVSGEPLVQNGFECDIYKNETYVYNYKCSAPCQMDDSIRVTLFCNCFFAVGVVKQVTQCTWDFEDDLTCPEVPETETKYDWQCDPRVEDCAMDQYPSMANFAARSLHQTPHWEYNGMSMDGGNFTILPNGAGNHPIIISPVLTQNVGDISAQGGGPGHYWGGEGSGSDSGLADFEELSRESASKDAKIAETKEKVRNLHSQIRIVKDQAKAEEEKNIRQIELIEHGFEREREELKREKSEMESLYSVMLAGKDKTLADTMDELHRLREILMDRLQQDSANQNSRTIQAQFVAETSHSQVRAPPVEEKSPDVDYVFEDQDKAGFRPRGKMQNDIMIQSAPLESVHEVLGKVSSLESVDEKVMKKAEKAVAQKEIKKAKKKLRKKTKRQEKRIADREAMKDVESTTTTDDEVVTDE